jgi:hypothetical protein
MTLDGRSARSGLLEITRLRNEGYAVHGLRNDDESLLFDLACCASRKLVERPCGIGENDTYVRKVKDLSLDVGAHSRCASVGRLEFSFGHVGRSLRDRGMGRGAKLLAREGRTAGGAALWSPSRKSAIDSVERGTERRGCDASSKMPSADRPSGRNAVSEPRVNSEVARACVVTSDANSSMRFTWRSDTRLPDAQ